MTGPTGKALASEIGKFGSADGLQHLYRVALRKFTQRCIGRTQAQQ